MPKIYYEENKETHVATGKIISEDEFFIEINDRYDGPIKIGKKFISKIKRDVVDDDFSR